MNTDTATQYTFHEVANIFPMMSDEEFAGLVDDIRANGQLQPIYVYKGEIVDGRNRYRACVQLGIEPDVREWDGKGSLVSFVMSLNLQRRHLDESQRSMVGARAKSHYAQEAKERQRGGQGGVLLVGNLPQAKSGKARDLAAEAVNVSGSSIDFAERVIERGTPELIRAVESGKIAVSHAARIATAEPEYQREVVAKVNEGHKPQEAHRQVVAQRIQQREAVAPSGRYRVIYADPPWSYGNTQPDYHPEQRDHYPVMSMSELESMPVRDWAMDDAVLFLWVTSPILPEALSLARAWGFTYKASFVWDKVKHNMGHYNSVRHEFLFVCVRGSCQPDVRKLFDSVVTEERTQHSRKPAVFREMIETIYTNGPYLELFARERVNGWDAYGNQA